MADRVHLHEVQPGDFVRFKHNPDRRYIVVANEGDSLLVTDVQRVTNPMEWEVLLSRSPMPVFKQLYK